MKIGGFQKVSLIDYPGEISSVVFCQGCNFRCPYCHNPELVDPELFSACLSEDSILSFHRSRIGMLDAVTVTGGEPTIQQDLASFLTRLKAMGYQIKLDTNGSMPGVLEVLMAEHLVDYIAMDIKGPLEKYGNITGMVGVSEQIAESVRLILSSNVNYEFRTTVVDSLLTEEDLLNVGDLIARSRRYALQPFVPSKALRPQYLEAKSLSLETLGRIRGQLGKKIDSVIIRPST
ncbi:MAG: anaerobic ribonucleoside-triphosphate reductase activating protein [Syntrophus sp. (in: bacteria)]|nr:anaerobic ribonucleoside-triphosphate reductase activating protein [Syntrophus sp. (in: bacteria)]